LRYRTEWVREQQLGLVVKNFRGITRAVEELLEPANFSRFRRNVARLENRAVFEIPGILEQILERGH